MKRYLGFIVVVLVLFLLLDKARAQSQTVTNGGATTAITFPSTECVYNWVNNRPDIGLPASGTGDIASFTAVNTGNMPITDTITVTPANAQYAYITDVSNNVFVINTATGLVPNTIQVGGNPWGEAISPDGSKVYVTNKGTNTVSVIGTVAGAVLSTIPVGTAPFGVVVSPDGGTVYVTNSGDGTLSIINAATSFVSTFSLPGALGIAESPNGKWLYVTSSSTSQPVLYIVNTTTYAVSTVPIGLNAVGVAVSPGGKYVYTANNHSNTVSVFNTLTSAVSTINVGSAPFGIVVSPDSSKVYVTDSGDNNITVIHTATNSITNIATPGNPYGISINADGSSVYVAEQNLSTVSIINTTTNTVVKSIASGLIFTSLGNFITPGIGCNSTPFTFTITVYPTPPPTISANGTLSALNTIYGSASASQMFHVSGTNMTAGILVTPPPGFEVSADNVTFSSTVAIGTTGTISSTAVYIRLKSTTAVGTYSGNIVMSSQGASNVNQFVPLSTVAPATLTTTADNKTKFYEEVNPVLTVTYNGFVNNESILQLITLPLLSTTAVTTSPVGQYPITISGAVSPNYSFNYVPGILTIIPLIPVIVVPNTFTPNGDGINDTWEIKNLNAYPNCTVEVVNRYGAQVFFSNGYALAWDGRYKGTNLPDGTYYYVITPGDGIKRISGFVSIIR